MSGDRVPEEEKAVEAADDLLAGAGEPPARALDDAPGNADQRAPGLVEEATGGLPRP